jgi:soluble lytic murein transglycosylase
MRKKIVILSLLAAVVVIGGFGAWYYWTHRYDKLIVATAQKQGLDPNLVKAIIYEESFFSPRAQSSQKAVGLMQVTPIVAQELIETTRSRSLAQAITALTGGPPMEREPSFEDAFSDPVVSLNVGCWYLKNLLDRYRNEPDPIAVALAAYNAGPANVERWAPNTDRSNLSREEFIARIEFPVTRNYVQKIIQRYDYYKRDQDIKQ